MGVLKNEIGSKYGKLTVISRSDKAIKSGNIWWVCKCECGNTIIARGDRLRSGQTSSCGCTKGVNKFIEQDAYFIGIDSKKRQFLFDKEDYEYIKKYYWYIDVTGYVVHKHKNKTKGKTYYLHRELISCGKEKFVDHMNNNKLDNRKSNLRLATAQQNTFNKSIQKNNTSGVPGVSYIKPTKKWSATIGYNNKNINLGSFRDKSKAIIARKEAEQKYFGEFAHKE